VHLENIETIFTFFIVVSLLLTAYGFKTGAVFLPTPKKCIRESLRYVGLKSGDIFYDLGAGTGKGIIIANREFGAKARGIEISPFLYIVALCNTFIHGLWYKSMFLDSLFRRNISDADVVFFFLMPKVIPKLKKKFEKELKPETWVISYLFPIDGWELEKVLEFERHRKVFIYRSPR
jgi:hypothetical protein